VRAEHLLEVRLEVPRDADRGFDRIDMKCCFCAHSFERNNLAERSGRIRYRSFELCEHAPVRITVVGAGVNGLTCAVSLLRAGADVRVVTAGAPSGTVSAVAGAMIGPAFGSGDDRSLGWERRSDAIFRELALDPATGVRIVRGRLFGAPELGPGLPPGIADVPGYLGELEPVRLPGGFVAGFGAELPFADMPRYLAWLAGRVSELGGVIEQRVVTDLPTVDPGAEYVVNCSGLGAALLAGDDTLEPVWGQHVVVHAPEVREFAYEGGGSGDVVGAFPHARGVLIGGVRRPGRNRLSPDWEVARASIARAAVAFPALADARVLGVEVGLRPGRPSVRLESERIGGTTVIHNYGHDSRGVFWSWGCAAEVVGLCGLVVA
jgi:D-amino-acid oxidase